jgi:hypothetical protein
MLTVSTYWSSTIYNKSVSLLDVELITLSRLPENLLAKNIPITIPKMMQMAITTGIIGLLYVLLSFTDVLIIIIYS